MHLSESSVAFDRPLTSIGDSEMQLTANIVRDKEVENLDENSLQLEEDKTQGRLFLLDSDIFDAEESDDDSNKGHIDAQDNIKGDNSASNIETNKENENPDVDEEVDDNEPAISPSLLSRIKKGAAKKSKKSSAKPKKSAMEELASETQRLIRESRVSLPYHRPEEKSITEIINKARENFKTLNGLKDPRTCKWYEDKGKKLAEELALKCERKSQQLLDKQISPDIQSQQLPVKNISPDIQSPIASVTDSKVVDCDDDELPDIIPDAVSLASNNKSNMDVDDDRPGAEAIDALDIDLTENPLTSVTDIANDETIAVLENNTEDEIIEENLPDGDLHEKKTSLRSLLSGKFAPDVVPELTYGENGIIKLDEDGDDNPTETKLDKFIKNTICHIRPPPKTKATSPSSSLQKLTALKEQLQKDMKTKRVENRKKRLELYEIDNEVVDVDELDDEEEAELTDEDDYNSDDVNEYDNDEEEDDEEEDVEERQMNINESPEKKNEFLDEEAMEDDDDDDDVNDVCNDDDNIKLFLDASDEEKDVSDEDVDKTENDTDTKNGMECEETFTKRKKSKVVNISDDESEDENKDDLSHPALISPESRSKTEERQLVINTEDKAPETDICSNNSTSSSSYGNRMPLDDRSLSNISHPTSCDLFDHSKTTRDNSVSSNMDELIVLCSGTFSNTPVHDDMAREKFSSQSMSELLSLCSGTFKIDRDHSVHDPDSSGQNISKTDGDGNESDASDDLEVANSDFFKLPFSSQKYMDKSMDSFLDDADNINEDESDKDEIDDNDNAQGFDNKTFKSFLAKKGKIRDDFVEEEAELSGSDIVSDDEEDDDLDEDILDTKTADKDVALSEDRLREQVGRVHHKRLLDEDERDIIRLQEKYLPDGDLHSEGAGRKRRFRWNNFDEASQSDMFDDKYDEERNDDAENEDNAKWRIERYEREKWLSEQVNATGECCILTEVEHSFITKAKKKTERIKENSTSTPKLQSTGSFLARGKEALTRIAKHCNGAPGLTGATVKNCVFVPVASDQVTKEKQKMSSQDKSVAEPLSKRPCTENINKRRRHSLFDYL